MIQLSIFNELGFLEDPIYRKLNELSVDHVIMIDEITITKNSNGLYELSSDDVHEGFKTLESCYENIMRILCPLGRAIN